MLERILKLTEVNKIILFTETLIERQVKLYEEYKDQFPNIYKERVADYLKPARQSPKEE